MSHMLDSEIQRMVLFLGTLTAGTPEYSKGLADLEQLVRLRNFDLETEKSLLEKKDDRLSKDTIFVGVLSSLQLGAVLFWENIHPITSRAVQWLIKLRL